MTKTRYISMDLDEACRVKWEQGIKEHRKPGQTTFEGDKVEELFQEFVDALNLVGALEEDGVELTGYHTTLKNMALALQQRERELRRRI